MKPPYLGQLTSLPSALKKCGIYRDSLGLYLVVTKPGRAASWLFVSEFAGRRLELGLGSAIGVRRPRVTRELARQKAAVHLAAIAAGKNPKEERDRLLKQGTTFAECAEAKIDAVKETWKHPEVMARTWRNSMKDHAKRLWNKPASAIDEDDVEAALRPIWKTKPPTAENVRQRIELVLEYAVAVKCREPGPNPARLALVETRLGPQTHEKDSHAALPIDEIPPLMERIVAAEGNDFRLLEILVLTALRDSEVRNMRWSEIVNGQWTIPHVRMKGKKTTKEKPPHVVPLSRQALACLARVPRFDGCDYVFTSNKFPGKHINRAAAHEAMKKLHLSVTPHGFRTCLVEFIKAYHVEDLVPAHWCIHHAPSRDGKKSDNKVGKAYDRLQPVEACGRVWQRYGDYCSGGYKNIKPFAEPAAAAA